MPVATSARSDPLRRAAAGRCGPRAERRLAGGRPGARRPSSTRAPLASLVHHLKYRGIVSAADVLAAAGWRRSCPPAATCLIPVPEGPAADVEIRHRSGRCAGRGALAESPGFPVASLLCTGRCGGRGGPARPRPPRGLPRSGPAAPAPGRVPCSSMTCSPPGRRCRLQPTRSAGCGWR